MHVHTGTRVIPLHPRSETCMFTTEVLIVKSMLQPRVIQTKVVLHFFVPGLDKVLQSHKQQVFSVLTIISNFTGNIWYYY